jgi:hypothetical protein
LKNTKLIFFLTSPVYYYMYFFLKESLKKCKPHVLLQSIIMSKSKTKFQKKWLSERDPSGHQYSLWCRKGSDEYHVTNLLIGPERNRNNSGNDQKRTQFVFPNVKTINAAVKTHTWRCLKSLKRNPNQFCHLVSQNWL